MSIQTIRQFQVGDVLSEGWEGFKANAGVLIAALIITVVISVFVVAPLNFATNLAKDHWALVTILSLIRGIVQTLISVFFQMGLITIGLKIARGQTPEIGDLFANFDKLATGFLVNVLLGIVTTIGFILLIVPGIIVALMTCLSMWFVVDRNLGVLDSIKASIDATRGSLLNLFIFGAVGILLSVIGAIPCGLGLLVAVPVLTVAAAHIYLALTTEALV